MNSRPRSRKKHRVEGNVSKIEKKEKLDVEQVGENSSLVKKLIRRFKKESKDEYHG